MFLAQVLVHSILAPILYKDLGSYEETSMLNWWIWGIVATVAAVIVVLTSVALVRQRSYELFLVTHIVMAAICLIRCWYHVWYAYENTSGYQTWLYATIAVWFFDRVARVARIVRWGFRHARVTEIDSTIVRIDVPGIRGITPGRVAFVYFPTLHSLRPWKNHPFSVIPTAMLETRYNKPVSRSESDGMEKDGCVVAESSIAIRAKTYTNLGLTLFVRKSAGITMHLRKHHRLLTLVEGLYPVNPTKGVLRSDRLLLIGGGIGMTGLLPYLWCHPNAKLYYSIKEIDRALVESLDGVLNDFSEKVISIGARLNIDALLLSEADLGWSKIAVVVCGPGGMGEGVRATVARLGKERYRTCSFELEVSAFSW